jgi:hypothetical protein
LITSRIADAAIEGQNRRESLRSDHGTSQAAMMDAAGAEVVADKE